MPSAMSGGTCASAAPEMVVRAANVVMKIGRIMTVPLINPCISSGSYADGEVAQGECGPRPDRVSASATPVALPIPTDERLRGAACHWSTPYGNDLFT